MGKCKIILVLCHDCGHEYKDLAPMSASVGDKIKCKCDDCNGDKQREIIYCFPVYNSTI